MELNALFLQHVAASYDKQMALGDLIGGSDWQFDMGTQSLTFGTKIRFKIQVIGTESTHSRTWLWSWANEASGIPTPMLRASDSLRTYGQRSGIREFTQASFGLSDQANGHILSMIASGLCNGDAYYRGPYDGGALFMLIRDDRYPHQTINPANRVSTLFPQLIATMPVSNQRQAFLHYLEFYLAKVSVDDNILTGTFSNKQVVEARFLPDNRLESIKTKMGA
ncbi:MAG: DUF6882 domain-containing protein [Chloroflexota bacterium]